MLLLSSCLLDESDSHGFSSGSCAQPGFALTFDDDNVDTWHAQKEVFQELATKATFFVTNLNELGNKKIEMLRELYADGHEIGSHGYRHVSAIDYSGLLPNNVGDYDQYVDEIILPSLQTLGDWGFEVTAFAYPGGWHNKASDEKLLNHFRFLRHSPGGSVMESVYYHCNGEKVVNCIWIDHGGNSLPEVIELFKRTKNLNKVIILCGHNIVDREENYFITPKNLRAMLEAAHDIGLNSYTFKDFEAIPRTQ